MARKRKRKTPGLNKRLKPRERLKLTDGESEIFVTPTRHGSWQIVAPPEFVITAEPIPFDIQPNGGLDFANRLEQSD